MIRSRPSAGRAVARLSHVGSASRPRLTDSSSKRRRLTGIDTVDPPLVLRRDSDLVVALTDDCPCCPQAQNASRA
jgi:hypothetical protein